MAVLEAVPYPKMSRHQTHEDRWFLYCSKRRAALELIPDEQLKHKKFVRQHTAHLRKIIAPPALNAAIMRAFETGIHPDSQQYNEHMDLDHKCTLKQMHTLIEAVIDYADAREAEGLKLPGSRQLKPKMPCVYWKRGTCTRGDRCPHSHAGPGSCQPRASRAHGAGGAATASAGNPGNSKLLATTGLGGGQSNPNPSGATSKARCHFDAKGEKCPRKTCRFRHENTALNPDKVKAQSDTCKCCGGGKHTAEQCRKRTKYAGKLKTILGYSGQPSWFDNPTNSKRSIDLFKAKGWRCKAPPTRIRRKDKVLPFKVEDNWVDGGWCWIGHGKYAKRLRLFVDLGSTCSFSCVDLYEELKQLAKDGKLGGPIIRMAIAKATLLRRQYNCARALTLTIYQRELQR